MFCYKCGMKLPDEAKFCMGCGTKLDEISPDTCRFWDVDTHEKLDKDRFRRNLGNEEHAYQEMLKRIIGE